MSSNNYIDDFICHLRDYKKTSGNTISAYEHDLHNFSDFLSTCNSDLLCADNKMVSKYKSFLTNSNKSVATISRNMSSLRGFYKYLTFKNITDVNPMSEIKNDKSEKKFFEILTEDEIDCLLAAPDSSDYKGMRDRAILEILYATGMKVSELISLDVSDVNLKMHCLNCKKNKSSDNKRVVLLYPKAVKVLEEYLKKSRSYFVSGSDESALFVNVNGDRMTRQGLWKIIKSYAELSGIKKTITPHTLRHSFATHLLENGADINDIKNILGHADVSSTQVYSDFIKSRLDRSYLKYNHRSK